MKILLDTNAYSALRRGDQTLATIVRRSSLLIVSVFVAGELLHGFRCGSRFRRNLDEFEDFLTRPRVAFATATRETADRFSRIAAALRSKGRPIPTNDIWIAAHAMETGSELVSYDQDFSAVDGLAWTNPADLSA